MIQLMHCIRCVASTSTHLLLLPSTSSSPAAARPAAAAAGACWSWLTERGWEAWNSSISCCTVLGSRYLPGSRQPVSLATIPAVEASTQPLHAAPATSSQQQIQQQLPNRTGVYEYLSMPSTEQERSVQVHALSCCSVPGPCISASKREHGR
jgi:hypothetical protein